MQLIEQERHEKEGYKKQHADAVHEIHMLRAELEKAKAASWKKDIKVLLMQARDDIIVLTQEKQQLIQGKQRVEKELAAMRFSVALQYDTAGTAEAPAATMYVNPAVGEVAAESRSQSSQFDVSPSISVSQEPEGGIGSETARSRCGGLPEVPVSPPEEGAVQPLQIQKARFSVEALKRWLENVLHDLNRLSEAVGGTTQSSPAVLCAFEKIQKELVQADEVVQELKTNNSSLGLGQELCDLQQLVETGLTQLAEMRAQAGM